MRVMLFDAMAWIGLGVLFAAFAPSACVVTRERQHRAVFRLL